jgi:hypothetical protein
MLSSLGVASAIAQERPADAGVAVAPAPKLPPYHHSAFAMEHSVSAQTLGVGDDYQTDNPSYTIGFAAKLRYYFIDDTPRGEHLSVRADGALYTELTNNDATTRRGEWSFVDTDLSLAYSRRLLGPADTDGTLAELRPLILRLPTSKISLNSGRYFAAGALFGLTHVTPILAGRVRPDISASVRAAVQYQRWFARATVPTSPELERVRLTPEGRALPGDQLSGASLTRDELSFSARLRLAFGESVLWTTDVGFQPAWKYAVADEVEVCGVVATGCTNVSVSEDDNRYLTSTQITTELSFRIVDSLSFEVGYGNATSQLGPDGRRRGLFYSPSAIFFASLSFMPHELATTEPTTVSRVQTPQQL